MHRNEDPAQPKINKQIRDQRLKTTLYIYRLLCQNLLGLGRSPGEGHGNPLQYSCLESPIHRGAWRATVHGVAQSQAGLNTSTTRTWHLILKLISFLIPYEATLFPELLGGVPQAGRSGSCALAVCSSRSRPSSFCWASPRSISPHSFPMLCLF